MVKSFERAVGTSGVECRPVPSCGMGSESAVERMTSRDETVLAPERETGATKCDCVLTKVSAVRRAAAGRLSDADLEAVVGEIRRESGETIFDAFLAVELLSIVRNTLFRFFSETKQGPVSGREIGEFLEHLFAERMGILIALYVYRNKAEEDVFTRIEDRFAKGI